jgi:F-type H+-transporting ATPase subunit delta
MISSAVFGRHARALADVALETQTEERVSADLALYRDIFAAVPDLLGVFHSPAVSREAKERTLAELTKQYPVAPVTANFFKVALQHNRFRYFHEIYDRYVKTVNERKGVVSAEVVSPAPLAEAEVGRLRESLARATGCTVALEVRTDPELLGGLVVQVGSTVYDGSIRSQLAEIKRRLAER